MDAAKFDDVAYLLRQEGYEQFALFIEAAGRCDKESALKFLGRVNEDEEMADANGLCIYPLMQIRSLLSVLPEAK